MLDLKYIRTNLEAVKENLAKRDPGMIERLDELMELDKKRKLLDLEIERLNQEIKQKQLRFASLMKSTTDIYSLKRE